MKRLFGRGARRPRRAVALPLHARGPLPLLLVLLAIGVTRGQDSSPPVAQTSRSGPPPASVAPGPSASVPPPAPPSSSPPPTPVTPIPAPASTPSNTPLPAPEMIEVPPGEESPPIQAPPLQLALPPYVEPILPPPVSPEGPLLYGPEIFVKGFDFEGNHVFSSGTLAALLEKYRNRNVSPEELEEARQALTLYYVNHGFINSGAVLPIQNFKGGLVLFQIVEGRLTTVNVHGNNWFQSSWLRNEVRLAAGAPLNFNDLKQGLQLMRENPTVAQVNAELRPGGAPGESLLDMDVKDTQPFRLSLEFVNNRPPSVGSEILEVHADDLNLTGNNDPLLLDYGILQSNNSGFELSDLRNISGSYTVPVTPWHTTLQVRASQTDSSLVEAPFNVLDITSNLVQYGATLRQSVFQNPTRELALAVSVDDRRITTKLFGFPFSLSPGDINGVEDVFALRFVQEFVDRSQVHVLSLRSTFSAGLNAFGATISPQSPDGEFFSWLGQGQYIRRLGASDNLIVLRLNAQVADRPLLSLEQFELGGSSNVRGYLENQVFRDNGVFGSAEVRFPVWESKEHTPLLSLAPFFDVGAGWNNTNDLATSGFGNSGRPADSQDVALPSVGVGLLFDPDKYVSAQLYWGYALNREQLPSGNNLQNDGISFDVTVRAF
jgi:hemolysin activation/secretion protein